MSTPRPCQRCERVRPTHGWGFCGGCFATLHKRGWLPVRLPKGYFPCRCCGIPPSILHYSPRTNRGLTRGLCHRCYQRLRSRWLKLQGKVA